MKLTIRCHLFQNKTKSVVVIILSLFSLSACENSLSASNSQLTPLKFSYQSAVSVTQLQVSEITFLVKIPANSPDEQSVFINILDEVTGLPFNLRRVVLQSLDSENYGVTITVPVGSVLKYRYTRGESTHIAEYSALVQPVRYRLYPVDGPGIVTDIVARWSDTLFEGQTGRITGEVVSNLDQKPVPGAMVVAGGIYSISASDGSFRLEGLPAGKHQLIIYALDGGFHTYKQGAIVAPNSATPALIEIRPSRYVNVTFNVVVPDDTVPTIPIKIAGNLLRLGNTFADMGGGVSTISSRIPEMEGLGGGRYTITLSLPVGVDIRYKYTLGDGIWNAEHSSSGSFYLRQLIIPEDVEAYTIEDQVYTWLSSDTAPIWFDVSTPANTPVDDQIYLQFKLLAWMEPIAMWRIDEHRWGYRLSSPTNFTQSIEYRFCRNAQCGDVPGIAIEEPGILHQMYSNLQESETLISSIDSWQWFFQQSVPASVLPNAIHVRGPDFIGGIALSTNYHPSWLRYEEMALKDIREANANWIILSPTWTLTNNNPPQLSQVPGKDMLWSDLVRITELATSYGQNIAIRPKINFPTSAEAWWENSPRDFSWWQGWFEEYRTFIIHHADLAEQQNAKTIIIGGRWIQPELPGGILFDGNSSNVPDDALERWKSLIIEIRSHFSGKISWSLPISENLNSSPEFLGLVDEIYLQWNAPVGSGEKSDVVEMEITAAELLDKIVLPFQLAIDKPIILALSYPSVNGGATNCISSPRGGCLTHEQLSPSHLDIRTVELDLIEQRDAYNAILAAVNVRTWISGVVSEGYFPPVRLTDKSISIHGKPAEKVLWYWFGELLGVE